MSKRALITGIAGQDGSYLADFLLTKGYEVYGVVRRYTQPSFPNIQHLLEADAIRLIEADLSDRRSLETAMETSQPDECYNLGAMSHVGVSFTQPELTLDVTGLGAWRVFEAARRHAPRARVYQAGSSEMFGNAITEYGLSAADEETRFRPCSPYGVAKLTAHHLARVYRASYGLHISSGILFNHESERRGHNFVTRKITLGLARIAHGTQETLTLGNVGAVRDWGYAPEYMEAAWRMLQHDQPGEWVVATGVGRTVQGFLDASLAEVKRVTGKDLSGHVQSQPSEHRQHDVDVLVGDASKARNDLGWSPRTRFDGLVTLMVAHDLAKVKEEVANGRSKTQDQT